MRTLATLHAPALLARHATAVKVIVLALLAAVLALLASTAGGIE